MEKWDEINFEEFKSKVQADLKAFLGDEYSVLIQEVFKNNDQKLSGLIIKLIDMNLAPVIYLEEYFEKYLSGVTLVQLEKEILQIYEQYKVKENVDTDWITDYKFIRKKIIGKLVSYERNRERLKEIPHVRVLDLAIIFAILLDKNAEDFGSITVHNHHLEAWGSVTVEEIYQEAKINVPVLLPAKINRLDDILSDAIPEFEGDFKQEGNENAIYIISNTIDKYGAMAILYDGVLKQFADSIGCNLLILPSSVHECLLLPITYEMNLKESNIFLKHMIETVNSEEVKEHEILSNKPYFYDRRKDEIMLLEKVV